jgi:predicted Zn-dependent protease
MPNGVDRIEPLLGLVQKDPGNALARYMLANEYLKAKRYRDALDQLEVYFGTADDEGAGYRMAAIAHLALGAEGAAKEAYRKGIEAATRHHHPSMAEEFQAAIADLS